MSDKPWVYEENGLIVYRASTLGSCIRSLTAARMGERATPPGEKLQAAFDRSSAAENDAIVAFIRQTGHDVVWQQKEVDLPIPTGEGETPIIIRGHIDGLALEYDDVLEVKSFGRTLFDKYDKGGLEALGPLGEQYRWQAAIYGYATQRNVRFVVYDKDSPDEERLIVEPAVDPERLVSLGDVLLRVNKIETCAANEEYPECDRNCYRGQAYSHVHIFPDVQMGDERLEEMLVRYHNMDSALKELEDAKKTLGDEIKKSYPAGTHVAGPYKAQIVHAKGSRLDTKQLRKDHPEIVEAYSVPNPQVRLTVTRMGGE